MTASVDQEKSQKLSDLLLQQRPKKTLASANVVGIGKQGACGCRKSDNPASRSKILTIKERASSCGEKHLCRTRIEKWDHRGLDDQRQIKAIDESRRDQQRNLGTHKGIQVSKTTLAHHVSPSDSEDSYNQTSMGGGVDIANDGQMKRENGRQRRTTESNEIKNEEIVYQTTMI